MSLFNFDYFFSNKKFLNITSFSTPTNIFQILDNKENNSIELRSHITHLPFISNCEEFGAYIPIWRLFSYENKDKNSNNTCTILTPDKTKPINIFSISDSVGDSCSLRFTCIYNENLSPISLLFNKPWVFSGLGDLPLFYLSKTQLSDDQYMRYIGMNDKTSTNITDIEFVPVNPKNKKESISSNYVPKTVNFTIYYYQKDASQKEISLAEIEFSDFVSYNLTYDKFENKTYQFYFNLVAWTWEECMINFMFPIVWYIVVLIVFVCIYISIFLIINVIARRKSMSGLIPIYKPKVSLDQGIASFIGTALGILPFIIPFVLFKLMFLKFRFGPILIDFLTDKKMNLGRMGGGFLILSVIGIIWSASISTPKIELFDKQCIYLF